MGKRRNAALISIVTVSNLYFTFYTHKTPATYGLQESKRERAYMFYGVKRDPLKLRDIFSKKVKGQFELSISFLEPGGNSEQMAMFKYFSN